MKKMKRTLTMILALAMLFALACPTGLAYADEEILEETVDCASRKENKETIEA